MHRGPCTSSGAIGRGVRPLGSYQAARASGRRPFVVTPYTAVDAGGAPVPCWPSAGPCAADDARPCRLRREHLRGRRTGPCFALQVASCGVHERAFTLYPPGHVPYGRSAIAPVARDGAPLRVEGSPSVSAFKETCFRPAVDAAAGRSWPRSGPVLDGTWWATQARAVVRQVSWLGVAPGVPDDRRAAVAAALDVPLLLLRDESLAITARPGYRARGLAVCTVLRAVLGQGRIAERLAGAAYVGGLVGLPLRWDPRARALRAPPSFRWPGTRAPPRR